MKFREFLKVNRQRKGMSQRELVLQLMLHDDSFSTLTIMTLGRWERGDTTPSTKKLFLICDYFQASRWDLLLLEDVKLAKSQIVKFEEWYQLSLATGTFISSCGYSSSQNATHVPLSFSEQLSIFDVLSKDSLDLILSHDDRTIGSNWRDSLKQIKSLINSGVLKQSAYLEGKENVVRAHSTFLVCGNSVKQNLIKHYLSDNDIYNADLESTNGLEDEPKFIFFVSIVDHGRTWIDFLFKKIITLLLDDPSIESFIITIYYRPLRLSFSSTFKTTNLGRKINNSHKDNKVGTVLEVKSIDFLAHHGVIDFIHKNNMLDEVELTC
jgi:transcriptional regulator with XRE-family HTH domain